MPLLAIVIITACTNNNADKTSASKANDSTIQKSSALSLKASIQLPNVKGGFDLMAIDTIGQRLFLAAEDNHTVEVLDVKNNTRIKSLTGFNEPKWIVYRSEINSLFISTADGKVTELDATTFTTKHSFSFKEKCNNLRFDKATNQLYVGVGKTFGSIGIIDTKLSKITGEIPLSDFPKQFEIDANLIYVNIPSKNSIEVIDRTKKTIIAKWGVTASTENVPMALDRMHNRLFVACVPGMFIVYDTKTGKAVDSLSIKQDADGIYYDIKRSLIYVSCGEGFIEVIQQKNNDSYTKIEQIATRKGAGTSLFSPALNAYFLAVPSNDNNAAELRVYIPSQSNQ